MYIDLDIIPQKPLRLFAKKLLYGVDLHISAEDKGPRIVLSAEGSVRFGPVKDRVSIRTEYEKGERLLFQEHWFSVEKKNLSFSYKREEKKLFLKISNQENSEEITVIEDDWWDPLALLLQINCDFHRNCLATNYYVLTNQKFSEIICKQEPKGIFFERKGEKQFYLERSKRGGLLIKVDKFKADVELLEAPPS